jgi:hypothetical protein
MESSLGSRPLTFEKDVDDVTGTNRLYNGKPGTTSKEYYDNPTGSKSMPINSQCDTFAVSNVIKMERKCGTIYNRYISSLFSTKEHLGSGVKDEEPPGVNVGIRCDRYPNPERKEQEQTFFGKLLRISSLQGDAWESSIPHRPHFFVLAYPSFTQGESQIIDSKRTMSQVPVCDRQNGFPSYCDSMLILVDTFENIEYRFHIASYINFDILNSDPKELIYYIICVAKFGFNHIIIIGETEYGMIFLDCYGRVFQWDDESQILWPLGDSLKEAQKYSINGNELGWIIENGVVHEYIRKPQCTYAKKLL